LYGHAVLVLGVTPMDDAGDRTCCCRAGESSTRRAVLTGLLVLGAEFGAGLVDSPAFADAASERPKGGDVFVSTDGEGKAPLEVRDIPLGGPPVLAWPMDSAASLVRSGSRLNKVLLVRLDSSKLVGVTRERAAEGIVAYSAICPHAGCEVSVWVGDQQTLECSCHYSHYNPSDGAAVIDGPAPRPLAALPLKIADGKLTVAKPFTGRVGIAPT
jgi:Rieske Fe-S protein